MLIFLISLGIGLMMLCFGIFNTSEKKTVIHWILIIVGIILIIIGLPGLPEFLNNMV